MKRLDYKVMLLIRAEGTYKRTLNAAFADLVDALHWATNKMTIVKEASQSLVVAGNGTQGTYTIYVQNGPKMMARLTLDTKTAKILDWYLDDIATQCMAEALEDGI